MKLIPQPYTEHHIEDDCANEWLILDLDLVYCFKITFLYTREYNCDNDMWSYSF